VIGYLYTGFMSLLQTYVENLRAMKRALAESLSAMFPKHSPKVG
jgi:hypothetical protein